MTDEKRITITDVRRAGHCASGARKWFADQGLDFGDFLKNGVPVEKLKALNDGFADQVIERTFGKD